MKEQTEAIGFIDLLFAVVVGIGFQETMKAPWFRQSPASYDAGGWFEILTLFIAFVTITLSWYGYHRSMAKRPITPDAKWGAARSVVDIVLLIFYWLVLVNSQNLWLLLFWLLIIWILYGLWDQFERCEHGTEDAISSGPLAQRRWVTLVCLFLIAALFGFYTACWGISPNGFPGTWDWVISGLILVTVIGYRLGKKGYG